MVKKVARWTAKLAAILTLGKSFFVLTEHSLAEHYLEHSVVDDFLLVATLLVALLFFVVIINVIDRRKYYV